MTTADNFRTPHWNDIMRNESERDPGYSAIIQQAKEENERARRTFVFNDDEEEKKKYYVEEVAHYKRLLKELDGHVDYIQELYKKERDLNKRRTYEQGLWYYDHALRDAYMKKLETAKKALDRMKMKNMRPVAIGTRASKEQAKAVPISKFIDFTNNKARCIWHNERTPSMQYYPKDNHVHCYGCNRSGDAIDAYMQVFGVDDFVEAIRQLTAL